MILLDDFDNLPAELCRGALTIGNFDGVHRGHARIVERLVQRARELGGPAVVFTFDPHPGEILRPQAAPPPLTWAARKAELVGHLGADALIAYRTDAQLLSLPPDDFFARIVCRQLAARALVEGPNFFFGCNRAGDIERLAVLCGAHGITLDVVEPLLVGGALVSSSRIRALIRGGDVAEARRLLTAPYRIRGEVGVGARRGASLGFATANLTGIDTLLPAPGVYAAVAWTAGQARAAAVNVGPNPTFGETGTKVEAHLLDFCGQLYGTHLELEFLTVLRETRPFPGVEALQEQLRRDVAQTRHVVDRYWRDESCAEGPGR